MKKKDLKKNLKPHEPSLGIKCCQFNFESLAFHLMCDSQKLSKSVIF